MAVIGNRDIEDSTGLAVIAGAGSVVCLVIAISCVFLNGACKKSSENEGKAGSGGKDAVENASSTTDTTQQSTEKVELPGLLEHSVSFRKKNESVKLTKTGGENGHPAITSEALEDNGESPADERREETLIPVQDEEARMSVIYAKPEKKPKNEHIDNNNQTSLSPDGVDVDSGEDITMKPSDVHAPDITYAKPIKNNNANVINGKDGDYDASCTNPQVDDDYATICDTPSTTNAVASSISTSPAPASEPTSAYEHVNLDDKSFPPRGGVLPAVPQPSSELSTPNPKPPGANDAFGPAPYGKSSSVRETTAPGPYAQTQIVPRSKSAHTRPRSDKAIVELGIPGIKNPSIKIPGSPSAVVIDIPSNVGDDDNPDYERVDIATIGSITPVLMTTIPPPAAVQGNDDNIDYERVEISKDAAADRCVKLMKQAGQQQTTTKSDDAECGWADNIIYQSVDNDSNTTESSPPQLVTYEQTNQFLASQTRDQLSIEDATYEEIRRSRLANFNNEDELDQSRDSTTYEIVDGKMVPFSEL